PRKLSAENLRERIIRRSAELKREWAEEEGRMDGEGDRDRAPRRRDFFGRQRTMGPSDAVLDHAQALADVLRRAGEPLGRADLLPRSGVPEFAWADAIKALKDLGEVVQEGEKRGTVYRLIQ